MNAQILANELREPECSWFVVHPDVVAAVVVVVVVAFLCLQIWEIPAVSFRRHVRDNVLGGCALADKSGGGGCSG